MGAEKIFENKVKKWLKEHNIWYLKTWSNGIQRSGTPDLICCHKSHFIGIELKAENGKPSPLQLYEIDAIKKAGGIAVVLKPSQWEEFKNFLLKM